MVNKEQRWLFLINTKLCCRWNRAFGLVVVVLIKYGVLNPTIFYATKAFNVLKEEKGLADRVIKA